jgi:hypothetical protein
MAAGTIVASILRDAMLRMAPQDKVGVCGNRLEEPAA